MGSLSQFIIEESVARQLNDAFTKANEEENWDDYFDDCHFFFLKATEERAEISFEGAAKLLQFYYDKIIKSSDNDITVYKALHMLDQMLTLCHERYTTECRDWYHKLAGQPLLTNFFLPAFDHLQTQVRLFAAQQLQKVIESPGRSGVLHCDRLLPTIIKQLGAGVTKVSGTCKTCLVSLCSDSEGLAAVFSDSVALDALQKVADISGSAKFNIYEVVQRVCVLGPDQLSVVSNSGWLDALVAEMQTGDTLSQLAALQLLQDLLLDPGALRHLTAAGVLHQLQNALQQAHQNKDDLAAINIPGLLKVFGAVGSVQPELVCEEHSGVVRVMLQCCCDSTDDPCLALIATETLAQLSSSYQAKKTLHYNFRTELEQALAVVGRLIQNYPGESTPRYIAAFARLLDVQDPPQSDRVDGDELSAMLRSWYDSALPCRSLAPVVRALRLPFQQLHFETYRLLLALTKQPWGMRLIAQNDGVLQYLLDRGTEDSKDGKELKWQVVSGLARHAEVLREEAGQRLTEQLLAYSRQGPFFVPPYTDTEVGIQGESR